MNQKHADADTKEARKLLELLLQTQPNLLGPLVCGSEGGEGAAEFCHAFIRKYSALQTSAQGQSPQ